MQEDSKIKMLENQSGKQLSLIKDIKKYKMMPFIIYQQKTTEVDGRLEETHDEQPVVTGQMSINGAGKGGPVHGSKN